MSTMAVQDIASLHERTVQQVARGALSGPRRRGPDRAPRVRTERRKVHPLVWAEALRLAAGDHHRIEVLSERSVMVHNTAEWS